MRLLRFLFWTTLTPLESKITSGACAPSFSGQLLADDSVVDAEWLDTLLAGAVNPASRYAVFSFLAGFWRKDYEKAIASVSQPTLVVVGEKATSISRTGQAETPDQRVAEYLKHLPHSQGRQIPGRNILPYESTTEFVAVVAEFVQQLQR